MNKKQLYWDNRGNIITDLENDPRLNEDLTAGMTRINLPPGGQLSLILIALAETAATFGWCVPKILRLRFSQDVSLLHAHIFQVLWSEPTQVRQMRLMEHIANAQNTLEYITDLDPELVEYEELNTIKNLLNQAFDCSLRLI